MVILNSTPAGSRKQKFPGIRWDYLTWGEVRIFSCSETELGNMLHPNIKRGTLQQLINTPFCSFTSSIWFNPLQINMYSFRVSVVQTAMFLPTLSANQVWRARCSVTWIDITASNWHKTRDGETKEILSKTVLTWSLPILMSPRIRFLWRLEKVQVQIAVNDCCSGHMKNGLYKTEHNFSCENEFYLEIRNHFHITGFVLSLAVKQRLEATRKWLIQPLFNLHLIQFWVTANGKCWLCRRLEHKFKNVPLVNFDTFFGLLLKTLYVVKLASDFGSWLPG